MSNLRTGVAISHRDQLPSSSRYELLVKIASGGMATVYVGRLSSVAGISRLVAVKRAHAHLLEDGSFAKMLVAEARLASKIHHPNVVAVHNVEEIEGELLLVMDYVEGASLHELTVPLDVAVRVVLDACAGLNAAHELADDEGRPLGIVHRDVSPHNILVGIDGIARLTDFGIAKSSGHTQSGGKTSTGALKGKVSYMAPEYVESGHLDARSDVFSLGVVAWEAMTHRRLFRGASEVETLKLVLATQVPMDDGLPPAISAVLTQALSRSPRGRFPTASAFGEALEAAARAKNAVATHAQVAAYVRKVTGEVLATRRSLIRERDGNAASSAPSSDAADAPIGRTDATASVSLEPAAAAPAFDLEPTKLTERSIATRAPRSNANLLLATSLFVLAGVIGAVVMFRARSESPPLASPMASSESPAQASPSPSPSPSPTLTLTPPPSPPPSAAPEPSQATAAKPLSTRTPHAARNPTTIAPKTSPNAVHPPSPPAPVDTPASTGGSDRAPPNPYAK